MKIPELLQQMSSRLGRGGALAVAAFGAAGALAFAQPLGESGAGPLFLRKADGMISGAAMQPASGAAMPEAAPAPEGVLLAAARGAAETEGRRALGSSDAAPRKIVRAATISLEVSDEPKARALARAAALKAGAEIAGDATEGGPDRRCATLTFRVAPERFDALLSALDGIGRVTSRGVTTQNLSEEYVDLRSRLSNARKVEQRLDELLKFKTRKLSDVLAVEKELERVGADIEQLEGRMKYIDALTASSVVTVTLAEPEREPARSGLAADVRNALVGAFNTFLGTGLALLKLTCWLAALALWVVPVSLLGWWAKKRWTREN